MKPDQPLKVLVEMRPALDGYAGIPQETRLLFRGLGGIGGITLEGLLQTAHRFLAAGTALAPVADPLVPASRAHRYARVVISLETPPAHTFMAVVMRYIKKHWLAHKLMVSAVLRPDAHKITLTGFETEHFKDYVWRSLFAKTLAPADFAVVTEKNYRICAIPWNLLQTAGLASLKWLAQAVYPVLDTQGIDIFIAQTPYPARLSANTALIVRYHDAFPIFMPHTIAHKSRHEATHYHALVSNVASGAYFACVSDATRRDLLALFPELEARAVTIPNMVAPHYYESDAPRARVPQIIRARLSLGDAHTQPAFNSLQEQAQFYQQHLGGETFDYLLVVSTLEPRKNHSLLLAAWEAARTELAPSPKLVIVGGVGWDVGPLLQQLRTWIDQGEVFVLSHVAATDLRILYRHAAATVCPSLAEGFDFSGVEAMASGGVVMASDIAVHREVYQDAAAYFDPYCATSLAAVLKQLVGVQHAPYQEQLRAEGQKVAARYLPQTVLPQWEQLLWRVQQASKT